MKFEEQLAGRLEGVVVVMGIGNPLRGDDAAGSLVAKRIACSPGVYVIDAQDVPEDHLMGVIHRQPDTIVLIDAVDLNSGPGSVALLDQEQLHDYWPSTHRMPIRLLMEILKHETHARVISIGIQPAHTEFLEPVGSAVAVSVAQLADMLNDALTRRRTALEREVPA